LPLIFFVERYIRLCEYLTRVSGKARLSPEERRQLKRAGLRFSLGSLQISGATVGVYLLITTGASEATLAAVLGTLLVSLCSRLVFARKRPRGNKHNPKTALKAK
jgi:hypothetical protein